jgi:hypothetical protein
LILYLAPISSILDQVIALTWISVSYIRLSQILSRQFTRLSIDLNQKKYRGCSKTFSGASGACDCCFAQYL